MEFGAVDICTQAVSLPRALFLGVPEGGCISYVASPLQMAFLAAGVIVGVIILRWIILRLLRGRKTV